MQSARQRAESAIFAGNISDDDERSAQRGERIGLVEAGMANPQLLTDLVRPVFGDQDLHGSPICRRTIIRLRENGGGLPTPQLSNPSIRQNTGK
jgi:hypothetical protein